jgi:hypothetical protein
MRHFGSYTILGDRDTPISNPHLIQTHPAVEARLLDPTDPIWNPTNFYLWSFPQVLYACVGERMVRAANSSLSPAEREQATTELAQLQRSIRRFFKRSTLSAGRPPKLTPLQRKSMNNEYRQLFTFIGSFSKRERPTPAELDTLFKNPAFVARLLHVSPTKRATNPRQWSAFLRKSRGLPLSGRCVGYLAFRYGAEPSTIQHAIWPRGGHPRRTVAR